MTQPTANQIFASISTRHFGPAIAARKGGTCPLTGLNVWAGDEVRILGCGAQVPTRVIDTIIEAGCDMQDFDADAAAAHLAAGGTVTTIGTRGVRTWQQAWTADQIADLCGGTMRFMALID